MTKKKYKIINLEPMITLFEIVFLFSLAFIIFMYFGHSLEYYSIGIIITLTAFYRISKLGKTTRK